MNKMTNTKFRETVLSNIMRMITRGLGYGTATVSILDGEGEDSWQVQMQFGTHKLDWQVIEEDTLAHLKTIAGERKVKHIVYRVYAEHTVPSFNRMEPDYTDSFLVGSAATPEKAVVDALLDYFRNEMYACLPQFESPIVEET